MKTAAERIVDFRQELEALLAKHRANLSLQDVGRVYCVDIRIFVEMESVWEGENHIAEYAEGDLGTYLAGKE